MNNNIKILIVDDETEILNMLEKYLSKQGYKNIKTFSNPLEAVRHYNGTNADIVLLDIMMPQMDGIETLEKLKASNNDVRVIMMTAYSTLDRVLKSHKIGADHYLLKPFKSLGEVNEKIQTVISE